jgi:hypothetical protein
MAAFGTGLFTDDDFLAIENVLYSPKEQELIARKAFSMNTSYPEYAQEVGYDYFERTGSAKILGPNGAKDIPFVGEKGGRVTQRVHRIATGIRYTLDERLAEEAKRSLGKGPSTRLDTTRVATARRWIAEKEDACAFAGDSTVGIKGIWDSSFYGANLGTKENVALGATGADDPAKRLWSNKTAQEILTDLQTAVTTVESSGLFKAKVLMISPEHYNRLRKPYSAYALETLLHWLNSEGMYFSKILTSNVCKATYNGDTVNYMFVYDDDPEVVQLITPQDIRLGQPQYDLIETMEMAATLKTAGVMVRHPSALYVGKGI